MGLFTPRPEPKIEICEYVEDFENLPVFLSCNMALAEQFPAEKYNHCVKINMEIYMKDYDGGLVSDAELAHIYTIESMISQHIDGLFAGRGIVCSKGYAFLMYYISKKSAQKASGIFSALLESAFRHTDTSILFDPRGNEYFELLYPDEYQLKEIQTQNIISKLRKYSDDGKTPRDVKFFLTFTSKEAVVAFASEAFKSGFAYVDMVKEPVEGRVLPQFKLILKVKMPFEAELVNEKIRFLMKLSQKFAGEYKSVETNIVNTSQGNSQNSKY
ncbi:MAG: DUF695 domain-containing protein [Acutalibacteraceae bacterium]|jgi:regulator of RNase E activity RraB|nr:DUF695 domain-containing protein [Clostridiales bacterium]